MLKHYVGTFSRLMLLKRFQSQNWLLNPGLLAHRQRHMLKIARLRFIGVKLVDLVRILVVWYDSYCCMTYETINLTKKDFSIYHNSIGNLDSGVNVWNGSIYYSVIPASTVSECCLYHISE